MSICFSVIVSVMLFACIMFISEAVLEKNLLNISCYLSGIPFLICVLVAARLSFRRAEISSHPHWGAAHGNLLDGHQGTCPEAVLLLGAGSFGDIYLRALQKDPGAKYRAVGFLDEDAANVGLCIHGVTVHGTFDDLKTVCRRLTEKGEQPKHIIFTDRKAIRAPDAVAKIMKDAEILAIPVWQLVPPTEMRSARNLSGFELKKTVNVLDLLPRPQARIDLCALNRLMRERTVLITGAGGSIGSVLTHQIFSFKPKRVIIIEMNELNNYTIEMEMREQFPDVEIHCYLCNIRDRRRVNEIFARHRPDLVFHVAALKHVPIVELNPCEGVLTNTIGTRIVADAARRVKALAMVQVSTDKAVNSTGVMGATKRLAELYCQAQDRYEEDEGWHTRFMTVRFGNVLGSSGSLIPLFQKQLNKGGPLTVTHPEMKRFFMTINEATKLTLQACAYGLEQQTTHGKGEIFVLDMGEPVKIVDIANRFIELAGFTPGRDIKIEFVGCRPGEKLFEELFDTSEERRDPNIPGILSAVSTGFELENLQAHFRHLERLAKIGSDEEVLIYIQKLLPSFQPGALARNKTCSRNNLAPRIDVENFLKLKSRSGIRGANGLDKLQPHH